MSTNENTQEASQKSHRSAGGSSAHIWVECSGYIPLKKHLPPKIATKEMESGTEYHDLAEKVLSAFLHRKVTGETNEEVKKLVMDHPDDQMVEAVLDYTESVWSNMFKGSITGKAYGIEDNFTFSEELDSGGTADAWVIDVDNRAKRVLYVGDFKSGIYEVPADDNPQLMLYILAIRKFLRDHGKDIDYAIGSIFQPKSQTPYKESKKITQKKMDTWEKKFTKALQAAYTKPKFKVGKHCQFCPCAQALICSAYVKSGQTKTDLLALHHKYTELPSVEMLPDETIAAIIKAAPEITRVLKSAKSYAIGRHIAGNPLPGLKVVQGNGRRNFISDTMTVQMALEEKGLVSTDLYKFKLKGIGQIEALLKNTGMSKKEATAVLEPITFKKLPQPSLVSEDDPRPALQTFDGLLDGVESGLEDSELEE